MKSNSYAPWGSCWTCSPCARQHSSARTPSPPPRVPTMPETWFIPISPQTHWDLSYVPDKKFVVYATDGGAMVFWMLRESTLRVNVCECCPRIPHWWITHQGQAVIQIGQAGTHCHFRRQHLCCCFSLAADESKHLDFMHSTWGNVQSL